MRHELSHAFDRTFQISSDLYSYELVPGCASQRRWQGRPEEHAYAQAQQGRRRASAVSASEGLTVPLPVYPARRVRGPPARQHAHLHTVLAASKGCSVDNAASPTLDRPGRLPRVAPARYARNTPRPVAYLPYSARSARSHPTTMTVPGPRTEHP